ncbi:unnamed protein product [Heligmosomoides polygyrus]|uniref:Inhibitor_I29 domain-containing protein n=1 Tax=Heligmosomoides polygyrus TaxID=6339 RepID=A0A183GQK5_HELPZ|nr:unnamed protein product [Heligmosomoides polygyrus]
MVATVLLMVLGPSAPEMDVALPAAGLDANVDDRRADFSTSWVQSVNQFSNTKVTNERKKMRLEEAFLKKLSGNRFLKMQFGKHRLLSSTTI